MIIRAATLSDKHAIFAIAKEQAARYPLKMDVERLNEAVKETIQDRSHFSEVVVDEEGQIRGALIGLSSDNLWAQRQNCNISLWVCDVPGWGAALLRRFRKWVSENRRIRVAGMSPDLDLDPRVLHLAERIGFARHGGSYLLYN